MVKEKTSDQTVINEITIYHINVLFSLAGNNWAPVISVQAGLILRFPRDPTPATDSVNTAAEPDTDVVFSCKKDKL